MNRNAIIFVLASLGILFGWQFAMEKLYPASRPAEIAAPAAATAGTSAQANVVKSMATPTGALRKKSEKRIRAESGGFSATGFATATGPCSRRGVNHHAASPFFSGFTVAVSFWPDSVSNVSSRSLPSVAARDSR